MAHNSNTFGMTPAGSFAIVFLTGLLALGLGGCGATTPEKGTLAAQQPTSGAETATGPAVATPTETAAATQTAPPSLSQNELNTKLWDAARAGDANMVTSLLQQGADAKTATASGETALHAAVAAGSLPTVTLLVAHGANVNAATNNGWTPLHHAARFSRPDIANYLRQQGADPKAATNGNPPKTPVQMALDQGDLRTARILGY
ncbi:MAG: ankyrin repeat domain-containing protein [Candidatus Thiothrix singaporensis]|uniref:Ankyrin repeat domain-containing protein n=1 Tax=Candidatus Thiothrix singaporensis TaxID=2799669 RepID=A0A7L6AUL0_9GAMM|nr:MAG: ankyrin repeat domain-containing protein [Candidatus Thiothrix singaporensis]